MHGAKVRRRAILPHELRQRACVTIATIRWRLRWATYSLFVLRPAFALDRARMSVAFHNEALDHYREGEASRLVNAKLFVGAYVRALCRQPDAHFIDGWFQPIAERKTA